MTFWTMTINQTVTEIYKNYNKVLCPPVLHAEIYNHVKGANKRLKNPFEVLCIAPWQILVREELEGRSVTQNDNIIPFNLRSEQNMDEEEKDVVESIKETIMNLDEKDMFLSARYPISMGGRNNTLVRFANAPYQDLTWNQFIERFKKVSKGTVFDVFSPVERIRNKNKVRAVIEKGLSESKKWYPHSEQLYRRIFTFRNPAVTRFCGHLRQSVYRYVGQNTSGLTEHTGIIPDII